MLTRTDRKRLQHMTHDRWTMTQDGIEWNVSADQSHVDQLEMSGQQVSMIVTYGQDPDGQMILQREIIYPLLRTIPNHTHASTICSYGQESRPQLYLNGQQLAERLERVFFNGVLRLEATDEEQTLKIEHLIYPSPDEPTAYEMIIVQNLTSESHKITSPPIDMNQFGRGSKGVYCLRVTSEGLDKTLVPGEETRLVCVYSGRIANQVLGHADAEADLKGRCSLLDEWQHSLVFESPDPIINQCFRLAKIRACESVFQNQCGLLHSPGGGRYYAAVWTNDQIEYAGPFFPFTGYSHAIEASINACRLFVPFMGDDFHPIPSSIIAEGQDIWEGAGDRGDASMYLYGLARILLANGDHVLARQYLPALRWCVAYIRLHLNNAGVILSDSDELEGRFPAGHANLCTSSLAYGGLIALAAIARELDDAEMADDCLAFARSLRCAIEVYFGANIGGFDTYQYYEGNKTLRSWLAIPLTMGIFERREQTIAALFSPDLWTENGLATQAGDKTFWDRATLYGLRGVFHAGESCLAGRYFHEYSRRRLLGDHVPYPVEAWPEGNQRHLSAESALYCRVVTEGIFGIQPTGFRSFSVKPSMPEGWLTMSIKHMRAFRDDISLTVNRYPTGYQVLVKTFDGHSQTLNMAEGASAEIKLESIHV